eukprot:103005_1
MHYGTEVATVNSDEDQAIAKKLCMKICMANTGWCQCWIGLQRPHQEWDDGTNADEGFTNWNPGQPDNWRKSEGCTELVAKGWNGRWNDLNCNQPRYFLCNLQSSIQRMDFHKREELIATRVLRHKIRWQKFQMEEKRRKIRKAFFGRLRQQQAMVRKQRREQQQKMREYYRQRAFSKMMGGFGSRSAFYGDTLEKRRRLREWIARNSDGSKRIHELRLEKKKHERERVEHRRITKEIDRGVDEDELFYDMANGDEGDEDWSDRDEMELQELEVIESDNPNPGPRRCVFVVTDELYELCVNDASISMKKYVEKVLNYEYNEGDRVTPNASEYDTMQFDELERFRYREAMDYDEKETRDLSMQIHKVNDVQFLKVIEFIFDHEKNHKKQCSTDEEDKYEMCLEFKEIENQMLVFVKKARGYLRDEGQWMSFEKDDEWDEVNVIYNGIRQTEEEERNVEKIKKCVTYLEHKVCVIQMMNTEIEGGIEDEYRVILIKLKKRMDDDDDVGREEDHFSQEYYDSFDF